MRDGPETPSEDLSRILAALRGGSSEAADRLFACVYEELRNLAQGILAAHRRGQTLQPTVLVHEAYLKLRGESSLDWQDRVHFFALASRVMRQVLVDHARRRSADRRGGGHERVTLDPSALASAGPDVDVLDLQDALEDLISRDDRQGRIVEMRYFAGLAVPEIAETLGVSVTTVERRWRAARAFLFASL